MYLKIMGGEDAPDSDTRKTFQLLDHVTSAAFIREGGKARVAVLFEDGDQEDFPCDGNAYMLNDNGLTVAQFGATEIPA